MEFESNSSSVANSMHSLTLHQTPSKKSRRNRETYIPAVTAKLCLVGKVRNIPGINEACQTFGYPVVLSEEGLECINTQQDTVFVVYDFGDALYETLYLKECRIIGYPALLALAAKKEPIPELERPLFSKSMEGVVSCFTGFRNREELNWLVSCIHHMGGSIRKEFDYNKITHLIASRVGGDKYQYAVTFRIPVMNASWVHTAWEKRHDLTCRATDEALTMNNLKIFEGTRVCWIGISDEEKVQMNEILISNGGAVTTLDDPSCTHFVIDPLGAGSSVPEKMPSKSVLVEVKWFWVSIQMDMCANEKLYYYKETADVTSPRNGLLSPSTPGSRTRKRKRLKDTVSQLAAQGGSPVLLPVLPGSENHRRRSSVSESGLLSLSGSFLDATSPDKTCLADVSVSVPTPQELKSMSPRHQVFMELLHTEMNYVEILETIVEVFKKPLEDPNQVGGPLLDPTEVKIIFGNLPPIHDIHFDLLVQLKNAALNWREDVSVGALVLKHAQDLVKAYPPFVNFFEQTKEVLSLSDRSKPRFHAFLKLGQSNPKCRRQSLQELLIRPVQRLPSISLLLNDLLKQTPKSNPDHSELEKALSTIKEVMTHINEDKRRTEGQVVLFDIFNDIENCPAHIVSSHRTFVSQCDVIELGDGIIGRGGQLTLFVFSDVIEICKRRNRGNTLRRDVSTISLQPPRGSEKGNKPTYKHVELISVSHIKRVIDINETEDCHNVFALICRSHYETKERLYSFEITSEDVEKTAFLRTLCRLMANITCRADAENYLACMDARQLDIDTSDLASGTLRRAARLASKTRMAVNRAFSFSKTPNRLKRAMSTVMSPLKTSTHNNCDSSFVSPMVMPGSGTIGMASSCANLATMDPDTGLKTTPSSSTMKNMKSSSLGFSAHKRL